MEGGLGKILFLDSNEADLRAGSRIIQDELPGLSVCSVVSASEYREVLEREVFDIVIIDQDLDSGESTALIRELKLQDNEPLVLGLTYSKDSKVVMQAYESGCHRCLVKEGEDWAEALSPALRQLLRMRRLEDENARLIAKLTEANLILHEKNERLDEFSATVAHDIRGPLGGICMRLEYLNDFYGNELDDRFQQLVKATLESGERLVDIVQAMYEFAKLGSRAKRMEEFELEQLVSEVVHDFGFPEEKNIHIGIDELPSVWGNKGLIRKIFINLIGNAVKYNDKETVIINIGHSSVKHRSIGDFVEIFVSDNGRGIPKDDLEEIFTLFRRGRGEEGMSEGIGLGLAVTKRIIEIHFGEIRVESELGEGTSFVFSLPLEAIDV